MTPTLSSIISRLSMKQLRLLTALDDHGSLLAAGKQVALTQPGASKALNEIEATFGAHLFQRTNRGLDATPVGRCVIRYARLICTDIAHLREELVGVMTGSGGRVAVGVIMGAVPLVTAAVSQVIAGQPDLSVEIVEETSASLLALVDQGRLDMAVCRTSVSDTPQQYESIEIRQEKLAVIASNEHPMAGRQRLSLKQVSHCRWVVYRANMPMRLLLEREFHDAGLRFPVNLLETTSALATLSLLQTNASFVALASIDVARFSTRYGLTCILPVKLNSVSEPYELVQRRGVAPSPAASLLIAQLRANGSQ